MKKWIFLFLFFALADGCSYYHAAKLPSAGVESYSNYQNQDGLKVALKFFDAKESKHFFGVEELYKECQPVYIIIENDTDNVYSFEKRMLGGQALLSWDLATKVGREAKVSKALRGLYLPVISQAAGITSLIDSGGTGKGNKQMREDYSNKEIKDEWIKANSSLSGVVFFEKIKPGENVTVRLQLVDADEYTKAMDLYRKTASAAKTGDAEAMYKFGLMYMDGHVVQQDWDEGVKWMGKASQAGWVPPPRDPNITFSSQPTTWTTWQQFSALFDQSESDMTNIEDNTIKLFTFKK